MEPDKMHVPSMATHGGVNIAMQKSPINYLNFRLGLNVHFHVCLHQNFIVNSGVGRPEFCITPLERGQWNICGISLAKFRRDVCYS